VPGGGDHRVEPVAPGGFHGLGAKPRERGGQNHFGSDLQAQRLLQHEEVGATGGSADDGGRSAARQVRVEPLTDDGLVAERGRASAGEGDDHAAPSGPA